MRIACLFNNDYEFVAGAGADAAAVRASAEAICTALGDAGHEAQLVSLQGRDLMSVVGKLEAQRPDLVFNLCESLCGIAANEVAVPAVLDLYGIPYTGSDAPALALALNKGRCKDVMHGRGISTPPYRVMLNVADIERVAAEPLDYPWFLKLANEDASVGITEANVLADGAGLLARAKQLHAELGGPGVGALGMCFSGGFALAMMVEEHTVAPVLSQPSLPFPVGTGIVGVARAR